jgi:hypothetical protein
MWHSATYAVGACTVDVSKRRRWGRCTAYQLKFDILPINLQRSIFLRRRWQRGERGRRQLAYAAGGHARSPPRWSKGSPLHTWRPAKRCGLSGRQCTACQSGAGSGDTHRESQHQARLAHARVTDQRHLEEIITVAARRWSQHAATKGRVRGGSGARRRARGLQGFAAARGVVGAAHYSKNSMSRREGRERRPPREMVRWDEFEINDREPTSPGWRFGLRASGSGTDCSALTSFSGRQLRLGGVTTAPQVARVGNATAAGREEFSGLLSRGRYGRDRVGGRGGRPRGKGGRRRVGWGTQAANRQQTAMQPCSVYDDMSHDERRT